MGTTPETPPLSKTPCDAGRCPATSLVKVERPARPAPADPRAARPSAPLTFCGHHFHHHEVMLAAYGWTVVADLRTWKAGVSA